MSLLFLLLYLHKLIHFVTGGSSCAEPAEECKSNNQSSAAVYELLMEIFV